PAHPARAARLGRKPVMLRPMPSSAVRLGWRAATRRRTCAAPSNAALITAAPLLKTVAHFQGRRWVAVRPIKLVPSRGAALNRTYPAGTNVVPKYSHQARIRLAATASALTRRQIPITVAGARGGEAEPGTRRRHAA